MIVSSRGFITIAQNGMHGNYIKMAYALALSLRQSQQDGSGLSIVVDDPEMIPDRYRSVFDSIITLKQDDAEEQDWKIHNKWQLYDLSPYDQTILFDADMLVPVDLSEWWGILEQRNVWACSEPVNFQGEVIKISPYRKTFVGNDLPMVYTGMMYFDKSELSGELFDASRVCIQNWSTLRISNVFDDMTPRTISGDLAFSAAMKMLGVTEQCIWNIGFPQFVHMRGRVLSQELVTEYMAEDWRTHVHAYLLPDCSIVVNNYVQSLPFHYHEKDWLTSDIIQRLESAND